jgi:hypothetical protein
VKSRDNAKYPHPVMLDAIQDDDDDTRLTLEQYMDRQFGPSNWARDPWEDVCITYDIHHPGPGIAYLIVDRQRRQFTKVLRRDQVQ